MLTFPTAKIFQSNFDLLLPLAKPHPQTTHSQLVIPRCVLRNKMHFPAKYNHLLLWLSHRSTQPVLLRHGMFNFQFSKNTKCRVKHTSTLHEHFPTQPQRKGFRRRFSLFFFSTSLSTNRLAGNHYCINFPLIFSLRFSNSAMRDFLKLPSLLLTPFMFLKQKTFPSFSFFFSSAPMPNKNNGLLILFYGRVKILSCGWVDLRKKNSFKNHYFHNKL